MIEKPMLVDENVETIRRIRREMNAQFKTKDEFFDHILKLDQERLRREKRAGGKTLTGSSLAIQSRRGKAAVKPELTDDNVEHIRRVRKEISAQFKTHDEFIAYVYKVEKEGLRRESHARAAKKARREKHAAAKVGLAKKERKTK